MPHPVKGNRTAASIRILPDRPMLSGVSRRPAAAQAACSLSKESS